ncbi:MAG: prepilin-type N-terminal cleavage/methylation protein [Solirubrobacterales bacterium]|nr:prepilin-type N-terminal cleavage/methylation protein [Solirubrobacterales bacterium]
MRRETGFTIVEMLVAILLLTVGVLTTISVLSAGQRLTLVAERQTTLAHRAQRELERLQSLSYSQLAMTAAPTRSTDPANPNFYVTAGGAFSYDRNDTSQTESFAIDATNGAISTTAQPWTDGRLSGFVYDYVTWTTDPKCAPGCPASNDYKRITVMVTLTGAAHPSKPVLVSTVVADPSAAPTGAPKNSVQNPLDSPNTTCQVGTNADGSPILGLCSNGISGTPIDNYLYDTSSLDSAGHDVLSRLPILGDHATHQTLGPVSNLLCIVLSLVFSGCQDPNLMGSTPPPTPVAPNPLPPVYKYSTDVTGDTYTGGHVLKQDVSCATAPSWSAGANQNRGDFWVTPPLSSNTTLNGSGGATLYMQSANGVTANVTICLGIYVAPQTILGLLNTPPITLGVQALANVSVPTVPTPVSFTFSSAFGISGGQPNTYAFLAGKRIGIRVWIAASAGDVALLYDHPRFASVVQVNAQ